MGLIEAFTPEDRVNVKFSDFYALMREGSRAELMFNAIKCDVPHRYIRETMTGKSEAPPRWSRSRMKGRSGTMGPENATPGVISIMYNGEPLAIPPGGNLPEITLSENEGAADTPSREIPSASRWS